jgi:hypothetical protein
MEAGPQIIYVGEQVLVIGHKTGVGIYVIDKSSRQSVVLEPFELQPLIAELTLVQQELHEPLDSDMDQ